MLDQNEIRLILILKKLPKKLLNMFYCYYFDTQNQTGNG